MSKILTVGTDSRFAEFNGMTFQQVSDLAQHSSNARLCVDSYSELFVEQDSGDNSADSDTNTGVATDAGASDETAKPADEKTDEAQADSTDGEAVAADSADETAAGQIAAE